MSVRLEKIRIISNIFASIAVPLVVAYFGWRIEITITEKTIDKDYVSMAVDVLRGAEAIRDSDLHKWATAIVDERSPQPLSSSAKAFKEIGDAQFVRLAFPKPPDVLMAPPEKPVLLEKYENGVPYKDFIISVAENYGICHQNELQLTYLQKWVREMRKIHNKVDLGTKVIDIE